MKSNGIEVKIGYQPCNKCEYKLKCEECVYNHMSISTIVNDAQKAIVKEILKEILYTKSCEEWFENEQLVDFGRKIVDKIDNIAQKHGIELGDYI